MKRSILALALLVGAVVAPPAAAQSADPPACSPYVAKWASVVGGEDVDTMNDTMAIIPTLCPALAAQARAQLAVAKTKAAPSDACGPARRAWSPVRDENDVGKIREFMKSSAVTSCTSVRNQAQAHIEFIGSLRRRDPAPTEQLSYRSVGSLMAPAIFGAEPGGPPLRIFIWARNYTRGSNVAIDACSPTLGKLTSAQPCNGPSFVEYDVTATTAASYALEIGYAALAPRSVRVSVNSDVLAPAALNQASSQWNLGKTASLGTAHLRAGTNTIRLESAGPLPTISEITLTPYAN